MIDRAGITAAELAVMIESGALSPLPTAGGIDDWLLDPPAHVRNRDWSGGSDAARQVLPSTPPSAGLLTIPQLLAVPSTTYVVRDLIPARGLIAIYGPPSSGKSFLTMDLVLAIASGSPSWFGRRLAQAPVAYVVLEGHGGIKNRILAWLAHTGDDGPTDFRLYMGDLSLLDADSSENLARLIRQALGEGAVVVIDTLSQATPGGDENSSIDMTKAIRNAKAIGAIVEGPVILIHHSGKDLGKGLRGHTSLLGAVDASIEVSNPNGMRSWILRKNKDGQTGDPVHFELVSYVVDKDQWGDELRSCAVRPLLHAPTPPLPSVKGKHRKAIMAAVVAAIHSAGVGLSWDDTIDISAGAIDMKDNGRRRSVAKETLEGLLISGHLRLIEGEIWPA